MANIVFDEFAGGALGAHWRDDTSGADPLTEVTGGNLHFQCKRGEQCFIAQDVDESSFDYWAYIDFDGTPADECDVQFFVWDMNIAEGSILISLAYINGPSGLDFYIWVDEESDNWGTSNNTYVQISQDNAWVRIKGELNGVCTAYYSLTFPTKESDWIQVEGAGTYVLPEIDIELNISGNPYYTTPGVDWDWYIKFFRAWQLPRLGKGTVTEMAALIKARLEKEDAARSISSIQLLTGARNKDEVECVVIMDPR